MPQKITQAEFLARTERQTPAAVKGAEAVLAWAKSKSKLVRIRASGDPSHATILGALKIGVTDRRLFQLESPGSLWIIFDELRERFPAKDAAVKQSFEGALRSRFATVKGHRTPPAGWRTKASWTVAETDIAAFTAALEWVIGEHERAQQTLAGHRS